MGSLVRCIAPSTQPSPRRPGRLSWDVRRARRGRARDAASHNARSPKWGRACLETGLAQRRQLPRTPLEEPDHWAPPGEQIKQCADQARDLGLDVARWHGRRQRGLEHRPTDVLTQQLGGSMREGAASKMRCSAPSTAAMSVAGSTSPRALPLAMPIAMDRQVHEVCIVQAHGTGIKGRLAELPVRRPQLPQDPALDHNRRAVRQTAAHHPPAIVLHGACDGVVHPTVRSMPDAIFWPATIRDLVSPMYERPA